MAISDRISGVLPDLGVSSKDDGFDEVYEAYEDFYRTANSRSRGARKSDAAVEFYEAVSEYVDADSETEEAAWASSMNILASDSEIDLMDEKLSEEELREALEG